jgi:dienelactone hydrolase
VTGRRGPSRLRWALIGAGVVALLWLLVAAGNTLSRYLGLTVPASDPAEIAEALRPHLRIDIPDGAGPFPAALLFSGCDGPADNLERWSDMLVARGWAAIVVDSHTPRDLLDYDVWRLVCAGQLMLGSERAGDVLVSIYGARRMDFVDPERLVLIGFSHGGWSIMELMVFEERWSLPFSLATLPDDPVEHPLDGVLGSILVYPYCGTANRARERGWRYPASTLFVLAENDIIAPAGDCLAIVDRLEDRGLSVDSMVLPGMTHGFDQQVRAQPSPLRFDPEATGTALDAAGIFLDRLLAQAR